MKKTGDSTANEYKSKKESGGEIKRKRGNEKEGKEEGQKEHMPLDIYYNILTFNILTQIYFS